MSLQIRAHVRRWWHCFRHMHRMENWYYGGHKILWCHECKRNFSIE